MSNIAFGPDIGPTSDDVSHSSLDDSQSFRSARPSFPTSSCELDEFIAGRRYETANIQRVRVLYDAGFRGNILTKIARCPCWFRATCPQHRAERAGCLLVLADRDTRWGPCDEYFCAVAAVFKQRREYAIALDVFRRFSGHRIVSVTLTLPAVEANARAIRRHLEIAAKGFGRMVNSPWGEDYVLGARRWVEVAGRGGDDEGVLVHVHGVLVATMAGAIATADVQEEWSAATTNIGTTVNLAECASIKDVARYASYAAKGTDIDRYESGQGAAWGHLRTEENFVACARAVLKGSNQTRFQLTQEYGALRGSDPALVPEVDEPRVELDERDAHGADTAARDVRWQLGRESFVSVR